MLFRALERRHGKRDSRFGNKKLEKQRYNLKAFCGPILNLTRELAQPENWRPLPEIVKELKLKQLFEVLERLLRMNDDLLYLRI